MAELELTTRVNKRDHREYGTPDGDLVIARKKDDVWHVTAHSADLGAEVKGSVIFNEGGFRGRQWESFIDGQQHPSLVSAMRVAVEKARARSEVLRFGRDPFAQEAIKVIDQRRYCDHCGVYGHVKAVYNRGVPMEFKWLCSRDEALTRW